jgi:hypothetical protein
VSENLNVIASLKAVSKELSSELEDAGVDATKRTKIVKMIDDKLSPVIDDLVELSGALDSDPDDRVSKTERVQLVKRFLGKEPGPNEYIDPETGKIRQHIFS